MNKSYIILLSFLGIVIITLFSVLAFNKISEEYRYVSEIQRIMWDDLEIEKKWLIDVDDIPYDLSKAEIMKIEQTYIFFSPEIRVRRINDGEEYSFAVKTGITEDGMTRNEIEENITEEEYKNMIAKKDGDTIYKTRYQFLDGEYLYAIDVFEGDLEGLAYLEIEFENQEEAESFKEPDWVLKDVTSDLNYKNGHLARYGIPVSYYEYKNK